MAGYCNRLVHHYEDVTFEEAMMRHLSKLKLEMRKESKMKSWCFLPWAEWWRLSCPRRDG